MTLKFTAEDVAKLAELSKLELTDQEKSSYATELSKVLAYVEQLSTVPTAPGAMQVTMPEAMQNAERADVAQVSGLQAELLACAPEVAAGHFQVSQVLGGGN